MLLLRHASAGERLSSTSLERARALDRTGRAQAARLQDALGAYRIERIASSPLVRCLETVVPLAGGLDLEIETREELAPDASKRSILRALRELPESALVCTHREVFETLFGPELGCEKGGGWVVERRGRGFTPTAYLPPPERPARARRRAALVAG